MARPITYSKLYVKRARKYLRECRDEVTEELVGVSKKGTELYKKKLIVKIPTIEGLAIVLKMHRDTMYQWANKYPEFAQVLEDIRQKQIEQLMTKGLSGDYNPTIAKLLLMSHGYKENTDVTTDNQSINLGQLTDEQLNKHISSKTRELGISNTTNGEREEDQAESSQVRQATRQAN